MTCQVLNRTRVLRKMSTIVKSEDECEQTVLEILEQRSLWEHERPFASVPKSYPRSYAFQDVSYAQFAKGVANAAWLLEHAFMEEEGCSDGSLMFAYIGPNDLRYQMLLVAAMKTGNQIVLLSSSDKLANQADLLKNSGCKYLAAPWPPAKAVKQILDVHSLQYIVVPEVDELLVGSAADGRASTVLNFRRPAKKVKDTTVDIFAWLCSSRNGRVSELIPYDQSFFTEFDQARRLIEDGDPPDWSRHFNNKRFLSSFPPFHVTALRALAWTFFLDSTMVLPPPNGPVTAESAERIHGLANIQTSFIPTKVLKEIAEEPKRMQQLNRRGRVQVIGYEVGLEALFIASNAG